MSQLYIQQAWVRLIRCILMNVNSNSPLKMASSLDYFLSWSWSSKDSEGSRGNKEWPCIGRVTRSTWCSTWAHTGNCRYSQASRRILHHFVPLYDPWRTRRVCWLGTWWTPECLCWRPLQSGWVWTASLSWILSSLSCKHRCSAGWSTTGYRRSFYEICPSLSLLSVDWFKEVTKHKIMVKRSSLTYA